MIRREFIALGVGALVTPSAAIGQSTNKVVRIGLISTSFAQRSDGVQAFRTRLGQLGYVEGKNLVIEIKDGQGKNDRIPEFAADLVRQGVDVIVPLGPYAIQAAKEATSTIPIVFTGIGTNFPLARSEGNITGFAEELIESTTARLSVLKEALPGLKQLGMLSNPDNYGTESYLQKCRAWAQSAGAQLHNYGIRKPDDIAPAFAKMVADGVQGIIAFSDSVIFGQRDAIVQTALKNRLPGVYLYREWVAGGGLLANGPNQATILGGPLPEMVDRILKGTKPSAIPVGHGKPELFINMKTASAMGITLPPSLLSRAAEQIK